MDVPLTLFYAFKQAEAVDESGIASTGWSTMLEGLGAAGLMVTATWPVRTELTTNLKKSVSALASSVVIACRPRPDGAGVTDRQGLLRALQRELPRPLHELQKARIAPVDLRQAAIGPGMAVFSRFERVIEPDGATMRVRTALGLINQVLDQVLGEQESEFDAETRWSIHWFSQYFADEGPYGVAEQLAVSMNVAVSKLVDAGVLASGGSKVRLLGRDELPHDWDPTRDLHTPVWEATQHLVKRLEEDGEGATALLLRKLGGLGESAALLAYRLYTVCEKARPALAGPYNALVAAWPEIQRLSREAFEPITAAEQQTFDA
jgi:putative DNA methylase